MKAWISGAAHQALLRDEEGFYILTNNKQRKSKLSDTEVSIIIKEWDDTYPLDAKSVSEVRRALQRTVWCYDALLASSLAIDMEVIHGRRREAALEAERLLEEEFARIHVLNTYCARPMPKRADIESTLQICNENELTNLSEIIKTVELFEAQIRKVREAWDEIKTEVFGSADKRSVFQAEAVRSGLFLSMVKRVGDAKRCEKFLRVIDKPNVTNLPHARGVLNEWLKNMTKYNHPPAALVPLFSITSAANSAANLPTIQNWTGMSHTGVLKSSAAFV